MKQRRSGEPSRQVGSAPALRQPGLLDSCARVGFYGPRGASQICHGGKGYDAAWWKKPEALGTVLQVGRGTLRRLGGGGAFSGLHVVLWAYAERNR